MKVKRSVSLRMTLNGDAHVQFELRGHLAASTALQIEKLLKSADIISVSKSNCNRIER